MAEFDNKTCARLEVYEDHHDLTVKKTLFVKSVWEPTSSSPTSFSPAVSDGHQGWTFEGSEALVKERADKWDKNVSWVMEKLKFYLSVGQPGVSYQFTKTQDMHRKVEYVKKCRSYDQIDAKNKELLEKIGHLKNEKFLFQQDIFPKFDRVVNSKKKKLRELREKLRRIEQLKAEGSIEKDDTTGSSSDDDDEKKDHH